LNRKTERLRTTLIQRRKAERLAGKHFPADNMVWVLHRRWPKSMTTLIMHVLKKALQPTVSRITDGTFSISTDSFVAAGKALRTRIEMMFAPFWLPFMTGG
jgi:hypothetical protein